jgi:hypothetical protein
LLQLKQIINVFKSKKMTQNNRVNHTGVIHLDAQSLDTDLGQGMSDCGIISALSWNNSESRDDSSQAK